MTDGTMSIIAFVAALAVGICLIVLYKRRILSPDMIDGVGTLVNNLPAPEGSGAFALILSYAKTAVLTVEQLVKTGAISPDSATRKDTAMNIISSAAKVDGIPYGAEETDIASACVEAEVQKLPRNQKTKEQDEFII